jgi:hypothetical protein
MKARNISWSALLPVLIAAGLLIAGCAGDGPGSAVADNTLVVNPYADVDWSATQHRGNFHTHTTQSDGAMDPARVIKEYADRGYTILALTDHNRNTWPWIEYGRDPQAWGMLAVSGNELSRHHHANSLFCELETSASNLGDALEEVAGLGGLAILNHPGRYWRPTRQGTVPASVTETYRGIFARHDHLVGMEIINQGNRYPHDRLLWDALLTEMMPARPVHAFCNDDMHGIGAMGRDWTVFRLQSLTEEAVREALRKGAFYAASISTHEKAEQSVEGTPVITRIAHDPEVGVLSIFAEVNGQPVEDGAYRWVTDGGEALHVGPELLYRDNDRIGSYVRAEIVGPGGTAFTNAFGFGAE